MWECTAKACKALHYTLRSRIGKLANHGTLSVAVLEGSGGATKRFDDPLLPLRMTLGMSYLFYKRVHLFLESQLL